MKCCFFDCASTDFQKGLHDYDKDHFKIMLTSRVPNPGAEDRKDLAADEVKAGMGYERGGKDCRLHGWGGPGGMYYISMIEAVVWRFTGLLGSRVVAAAVVYNHSKGDRLLCWWQMWRPEEMVAGDTFSVDPDAPPWESGKPDLKLIRGGKDG